MSRYDESAYWGGTADPEVSTQPPSGAPGRNYADLIYGLPDLSALRAVDGQPLTVREDGEGEGVLRPLLRRVIGALARPLASASAELDAEPLRADPSQPEAATRARVHLLMAGYPLPADTPDAWALALLRALPDLLPGGRAETYLRTAEVLYGRGSRRMSESGPWRIQEAITARDVRVAVIDTSRPAVGVSGRALRVISDGGPPAFARLLAALAPAHLNAEPQPQPGPPLLVIGQPPAPRSSP